MCDKPQSVMILIQQQREEESTTHITSTQRSTSTHRAKRQVRSLSLYYHSNSQTRSILYHPIRTDVFFGPTSLSIAIRYHQAWNKILTSPNATNLLIWRWEFPLQRTLAIYDPKLTYHDRFPIVWITGRETNSTASQILVRKWIGKN